MNMKKFITSLPSIFFAALIVFMAGPTHAALIDKSGYTTDSESGLDWLDENLTAGLTYTEATTRYSGWRPATNAEVEDLFWKAFDGFAPTREDGRSYGSDSGVYPDNQLDATNFFNLFGPHDDYWAVGMYEDEDGILRQMGVRWGLTNSWIYGLELTSDQEYRRDWANSSTSGTFLVRDSNTPPLNGIVTLWGDYPPEMLGLTAECHSNPYYPCGSSSLNGWFGQGFEDGGGGFYVEDFGLSMDPAFDAQAMPWIKIIGFDFSPFTDGGGCNINNSISHAGTKTSATDLGNGKCRLTVDNDYIFLPPHKQDPDPFGGYYGIPGTGIYHYPDGYAPFWYWTVDNLVLEVISENVVVDYSPWNTDNKFHPKNPGWTIYIEIETTRIADGDPYDFNAADINPTTLKVGPGLAQVIQYQGTDIDGDGDTDYTFTFNIGDTGITCLDTSITIAGRTYSGAPIAGSDFIVTVGCEETVDIDVDPFNVVNTIRPNDNYNVIVALLGMRTSAGDAINLYPERERTFNAVYSANGVDRETLRLGPAETAAIGTPIVTDIDGDSYDDLLVNFNVYDAGIACGDTELKLIGNMNSGLPIEGFDTIVTEDCSTGTCHP